MQFWCPGLATLWWQEIEENFRWLFGSYVDVNFSTHIVNSKY